jgi:hypothetical protein
MTEQWKEITNFEGRFEISSLGRIRSVSRLIWSERHKGYRRIKSKILRATLRSEYPTIKLRDADGDAYGCLVHRLVANAFIPNPYGLPIVSHVDDDLTNNRSSNLRWSTFPVTIAHSYEVGRRPTGQAHHFASLERNDLGYCLKRSQKAVAP